MPMLKQPSAKYRPFGQIDHARISADDPPNLASAIRTWLMAGAARSAR